MFKPVLEKVEEPEIKLLKAREFQKNIYFFSIDYTKAFDCVDNNKLWKILQGMEIPDHLTWLLRNMYVGQELQLEVDMEQQTVSKQEKEYIKAVCCHQVYLTSVQSMSWDMLGWIQDCWEKYL